MPIPLLIPILTSAAALAAGAFGVKKGLDAKEDFATAERWDAKARTIYNEASDSLEAVRTDAADAMNRLGQSKFEIYELQLIPFVEAFSRIKHVDFQDKELTEQFDLSGLSQDEMQKLRQTVLELKEVFGGGIAALGAGGLAGLAAYGGVGLLGTASTGATIAGLSGVAATNATLAWLGGGALSAGGLGVAGGTAVLGGIVAGPVLAVGGMILASKAEEAKHNAYANHDLAVTAAEQMKTAEAATEGLRKRFSEMRTVLSRLRAHFDPMLLGLEKAVARSNDYASYSREDRIGVMMAAAMAKSLKNLLEVPLLNQDGSLTEASSIALQEARDQLGQLG